MEELKNPKTPLPAKELVFGKTFTDHMLMVEWSRETGWAAPLIKECEWCILQWCYRADCVTDGPLSLDPSSSVFHYAFCLYVAHSNLCPLA